MKDSRCACLSSSLSSFSRIKYHLDIYFTFSLSHHIKVEIIGFITDFIFAVFCYNLRINIWKNFSFRHAICEECCLHSVDSPRHTLGEREWVRENTEQCKMETDNRPSASCILKYKQLAFGFASDCSTWRCSSCTQSFQISNFAALFHWIHLVYTLIYMFCCHRAMPVFRFSLACFARNFYSSILELFNSILFSFFSFYFFFALYFAIVTRKTKKNNNFSHLSFISDISNFRRFNVSAFIVTLSVVLLLFSQLIPRHKFVFFRNCYIDLYIEFDRNNRDTKTNEENTKILHLKPENLLPNNCRCLNYVLNFF